MNFIHCSSELLILCENLYRHLQGAMEQRDDYIETIIDFVLLQDSEEGAREEREGNKEVSVLGHVGGFMGPVDSPF